MPREVLVWSYLTLYKRQSVWLISYDRCDAMSLLVGYKDCSSRLGQCLLLSSLSLCMLGEANSRRAIGPVREHTWKATKASSLHQQGTLYANIQKEWLCTNSPVPAEPWELQPRPTASLKSRERTWAKTIWLSDTHISNPRNREIMFNVLNHYVWGQFVT